MCHPTLALNRARSFRSLIPHFGQKRRFDVCSVEATSAVGWARYRERLLSVSKWRASNRKVTSRGLSGVRYTRYDSGVTQKGRVVAPIRANRFQMTHGIRSPGIH